MTPPTSSSAVPARQRWALFEAVAASTIGTTIEWYDFFLYGTATALVFPALFFPTEDPFVSRILSFSTFTIGFIARPLGGLIFGHLGDRIGRKSTLVATLLLMGVSTFVIGLMPNYHKIGVAAPLTLAVLRFIQGVGVGGEWGGSVLLAVEYGHRGRRGFYASWPQAGVPLGLLSSTGVVTLVAASMSREDFENWGWRIPFLLSGVLIAVGFVIRLRVMETPLFAELQETNQLAKAPISEAVRNHWREILLVAGSRIAEQSCFYLFAIWVLDYAKEVKIEPDVILLAVNCAAAIEFFTIPIFGLMSDHLSRRGTYVLGCVFLACFAFPYFALLATQAPLWIFTAVILSLAGGHALLYSVQASLIPELFGTRLRYTGASLGYQLASPVAGGLAPLIAVFLVRAYPKQYWPLAVYIIVICLISLLCVRRLAETSRKDISAADG